MTQDERWQERFEEVKSYIRIRRVKVPLLTLPRGPVRHLLSHSGDLSSHCNRINHNFIPK